MGAEVEPTTYSGLASRARRFLICVLDAAIDEVAPQIVAMEGTALHTCGTKGADALAVLRQRGLACGTIHPLQTVTDGESGAVALRGATYAISGDAAALEWAEQIVALLGGEVLRVPDAERAKYHAAAVLASNSVAALLSASVELMESAGVKERAALLALAPILRTSVENILRDGPEMALTGPIERGDSVTVAMHLEALRSESAPVQELYRAAGVQTLELAKRRGLDSDRAATLEQLLRKK